MENESHNNSIHIIYRLEYAKSKKKLTWIFTPIQSKSYKEVEEKLKYITPILPKISFRIMKLTSKTNRTMEQVLISNYQGEG